jgi:diguanylate cyclase (GGDEF)-like protein
LTNALTDALTSLPNERAFFLVLENQIAEAQRFFEQRPLTILAIDIRSFAEHNRRFGHATGDRLLLFAADKIKSQLRQMDFLARSTGDEFIAVLPTASIETAREVIERVEKAFVASPFEISDEEKIHLQLSFGAAMFGRDGETANELLRRASLRKRQAKSQDKENKILWFPKEYVN